MTPDPLRLEDLIARHFDGALDAAEEAELAVALSSSAEARARIASYMRIEGAVSQLAVTGLVDRAARPVRRARRFAPEGRPVWAWVLGAAAAASFLIVIASGLSTPPAAPTAQRPPVRPGPEAPASFPDPERRPVPAPLPRPEAPAPAPTPVASPTAPAPPRTALPETPSAPAPLRAPDRPAAPLVTEAVVARLLEGEGAPLDLRAGQGVRGKGTIEFTDKTRLEVGPASLLRGLAEDVAGKRVHLEVGTLAADVARQLSGRAFVLTTPQAEVCVLGTRFTLAVTAESTRLEVLEGRVRLTRLGDKRSVEVMSGQFALAAPGAPPRARPLPIDEIVLYPGQGQLTGNEWRPLKHDKALDGLLLDATDTANKPVRRLPIDAAKVNSWFAQSRSRSWVSFTFDAEAGKDYRVWIRGRCVAPAGQDRMLSDSVMMEVAKGRFVDRPADWHPYSDYLCSFDGYFQTEGFSWSGGFFDPDKTQKPIGVRFNASGKQLIRIHAMETPVQFDAIWISATQASRPDADRRPGKK